MPRAHAVGAHPTWRHPDNPGYAKPGAHFAGLVLPATEEDSLALLDMSGAERLGAGGHALLRLEGRLPVPGWAYRLPADRPTGRDGGKGPSSEAGGAAQPGLARLVRLVHMTGTHPTGGAAANG